MTITASARIARQFRIDDGETVNLAAAAARLADSSHCPSWCTSHVSGDHVLHLSDDVSTSLTGHGEHHAVHLSLEQGEHTARGLEPAAIRMNDNPMTPDEALHLAGLLILLARRAVTR